MHKNTKLLPYQRRDIFSRWKMGTKIAHLAREYKVTRKTIYETLKDAKLGIFENRKSINERYRTIYWGMRRLSAVERELGKKIAKREHRNKRYEKSIPGEMVHLDTKRLPLLRGEAVVQPREYLFVAIDDYSRWLYADIFPDKTSYSAAIFVEEARQAMPFPITGIYSDNGSEYKGKKGHPVFDLCAVLKISHGYTKVKHPWTNGKAERVIKTLMTEWCSKSSNFISREHRRRYLYAFVSWYNQNRIHQSIGTSPLRRLEVFYAKVKEEMKCVYNACN